MLLATGRLVCSDIVPIPKNVNVVEKAMDAFNKTLGALGAFKTPISITALIIIVFYYLIEQILKLDVFVTITQADTKLLLDALLSKLFWLAIAGLIFGGLLFSLPYVLPIQRSGKVHLVDARLNSDLSAYSAQVNEPERKSKKR